MHVGYFGYQKEGREKLYRYWHAHKTRLFVSGEKVTFIRNYIDVLHVWVWEKVKPWKREFNFLFDP